jgi:integrase/recombinase XerD
MTKTIQNFRNYLLQLGYSKSSVYMLPECVKEFLEYHNTTTPEAITQKHIESFYNWLHIRPHKRGDGGLSESYIYHHVYAIKLFFTYLEETGQINYNPISTMRFKPPKHNSRQPLTQEEIAQLFETAQTLKETTILHLFYSCGLRRSEAVELNTKDIHFKNCLLYVRQGKGHKRRAIPITTKVSEELENYYLQERSDSQRKAKSLSASGVNPEAFILNRIGKRMSGDSYNRIIKEIVEKSGIKSPCTLHHLRHSIATHLLENGLSLENVRDFLGHSYLESTQIYTHIKNLKIK